MHVNRLGPKLLSSANVQNCEYAKLQIRKSACIMQEAGASTKLEPATTTQPFYLAGTHDVAACGDLHAIAPVAVWPDSWQTATRFTHASERIRKY